MLKIRPHPLNSSELERVELHVQNQVGVYKSRNAQPIGS